MRGRHGNRGMIYRNKQAVQPTSSAATESASTAAAPVEAAAASTVATRSVTDVSTATPSVAEASTATMTQMPVTTSTSTQTAASPRVASPATNHTNDLTAAEAVALRQAKQASFIESMVAAKSEDAATASTTAASLQSSVPPAPELPTYDDVVVSDRRSQTASSSSFATVLQTMADSLADTATENHKSDVASASSSNSRVNELVLSYANFSDSDSDSDYDSESGYDSDSSCTTQRDPYTDPALAGYVVVEHEQDPRNTFGENQMYDYAAINSTIKLHNMDGDNMIDILSIYFNDDQETLEKIAEKIASPTYSNESGYEELKSELAQDQLPRLN